MKVALWPILFVVFLPLCLFFALVNVLLPTPTESLHKWNHFGCFMAISYVLVLPVLPVVFISLFLDYTFYYIFGILWCTMTCRWSAYSRSMAALAPFKGGPSVWAHLGDYLVALSGQVCRRGPWWMASAQTFGVMGLPWLKYWLEPR